MDGISHKKPPSTLTGSVGDDPQSGQFVNNTTSPNNLAKHSLLTARVNPCSCCKPLWDYLVDESPTSDEPTWLEVHCKQSLIDLSLKGKAVLSKIHYLDLTQVQHRGKLTTLCDLITNDEDGVFPEGFMEGVDISAESITALLADMSQLKEVRIHLKDRSFLKKAVKENKDLNII